MEEVPCPGKGTQAQQASQMVVEHRLNVLEPLQFRSCLVIVKNPSIEHEAGHDQGANGQAKKLKLAGDSPGSPYVEET